MGWVIRDPRIIWWGEGGRALDPRGSVIRGPPTTKSLGHGPGSSFLTPNNPTPLKDHTTQIYGRVPVSGGEGEGAGGGGGGSSRPATQPPSHLVT